MTLSHELADYSHRLNENERFPETDMMGHVNNTVFGYILKSDVLVF